MNEIVQLYKTLTSNPWAAQLLAKASKHPMGGRVMDVVNGPVDPKTDLAETGLTAERREAYVPLVSSLLAENLDPTGSYTDHRYSRELVTDAAERMVGQQPPLETDTAATDSWRLYLGLPQERGTFGVSDFRPTREGEGEPVPHYYKINDFWQNHRAQNDPEFFPTESSLVRYLVDEVRRQGGRALDEQGPLDPMGAFTWTHGSDANGPYLSYYDRYDLEPRMFKNHGPVKVENFIGKPFEIYDRIYYDPQTYEPVPQPVMPPPAPVAPSPTAQMKPDPIAFSPYAGLFPPSQLPPAPELDWRKVPSPFDGLFTQQEMDRESESRSNSGGW